jgi:hypothetical protein
MPLVEIETEENCENFRQKVLWDSDSAAADFVGRMLVLSDGFSERRQSSAND